MISKNMEKYNEIKDKYDTIFDNLCFSKEFKNAMLEKFGYCPGGLTADTRYNETTSNLYFVICCKEYGYEYRGERVTGDYVIKDYEVNDEMFQFVLQYIADNLDIEIVNELNRYEGFIN